MNHLFPNGETHDAHRRHYVLLDNKSVLEQAAERARALGFAIEIATDISEQHVTEGCEHLLTRFLKLRRSSGLERVVCLVSGGEFKCPVRGAGYGGRNAETALRLAIEMDAHRERTDANHVSMVALSAGTDGIDGNSPAAGALADELTLTSARALQLDARRFLDASDAYSFFAALDDALMTGPTGTNVRDLRLMLASGHDGNTIS